MLKSNLFKRVLYLHTPLKYLSHKQFHQSSSIINIFKWNLIFCLCLLNFGLSPTTLTMFFTPSFLPLYLISAGQCFCPSITFVWCFFFKNPHNSPSPLQGHKTHWSLFDWPPEENHKQHTVSSAATSPHPSEWISSLRPFYKARLCFYKLSCSSLASSN